MHVSHLPHGSTVGRLLLEGSIQFSPLAIILAVEVLPIPLEPVNKKA